MHYDMLTYTTRWRIMGIVSSVGALLQQRGQDNENVRGSIRPDISISLDAAFRRADDRPMGAGT